MPDQQRFKDFEKDSLYAILEETEKLAEVGGWEWDIAKDVWTFSDNWLRIHGCSDRHVKTADLIKIAHPDDRTDIQMAFDKAVAEGADYEIEHRIIRQDTGEERYIRSLGRPRLDRDGNTVKLFGSAQDITKHKKAEEKLRQTRILLESSIESTRDMIFLSLDREYRYLYFNKAHSTIMLNVYGANPQVGDCIFDHMKGSEDIKTIKAHYDRALAGDGHVAFDEYGEGQLRYSYEVRYNPIYNEKKEVLGVSVFAQNITERTVAEKALFKSEMLLKEAQRVGKIGHWELDSPSGKPVWSDEIFHIFGLDPRKSEPSFEAHKNIIHEADWDLIQTSIEKLGSNGTPFDVEFRILRTDGKIGWMHAIGSAEKNKDGYVERMFGIAQDITDRKQSEKAMRQNNEMFKRTESIAHVGSWEWDILPDRVRWSDELFRIFGRDPSPNAVSWEDHRGLYVAEDMQRLREAVEICVDQGRPFEIELRAIRTDGQIRHCISRGQAQTDENGRIIRLVGSLQDITERKHAEKKLKESEEKYRLIAENMADVITIINMDLNFTYVSPSIIKLRGFTVEEAMKQSIDQIMTPESFKRLSEAVVEELRMEESGTADPKRAHTIELEEYKKDGSVIWVENTASFIRDNDQKPVGILVVSRDITDRKMAETEILHQKNRAEQYLQLAGVMFIGLDADGKINVANKKACEILECSETEVIGRNWFDTFIPKSIRNDVQSVFRQLIAGEVEPVEYFENTVLTKQGQEKQIAWHNAIITDDDNTTLGCLSSGEDITEKRQLEKKLIQAQKMEAIGTLAGGIAHDFNNILSSVIGFSELALDDVEKDSSIEDSLQEIYSGGKRARDLVKQILAFARQSDEAMKPVQIDTIAGEAIKLLRASIPATIKIHQNIEKNLTIMGNSTQVHQILMNLCTNAAQAMEDGGVLEINIQGVVLDKKNCPGDLTPGEYAKIRISDTGAGVDPEVMDKIFDPYFTTKETGKGTGMGLALVHGIVETYNGMITADNLPVHGAVFTVYLPLIRGNKKSELYQPEILPTGDERILLVDDETAILKMSSQVLQKLGYEVVFRTSSTKALELFRSNPDDFDLVITDMTMPDMTGDKLAVELMSIRRDIPVILCTGYSSRISDSMADQIGIKAFAYKPVSKADLAKTVRKVLDEAKGSTQGSISGT